ncbi:class I adenylate-forming enzyme family protein [Reinekea blandensis]|uniref:Putative acid-CoA ligase n=1 Tax=Reinekea blandensis MED297 TaxID=314283 RepID=A4BDV7_9GAMM|nr:AMP-binding protein [Reinekea blandensis]EAR09716.1 putative acid-CoA ligase [Reinekea blandensis MED297]
MNPINDPVGQLATRFERRIALIDADSAEQWSYQDLHRQVQNWCGFLKAKGLQSGQVVVWITRNRIDFFAALFAAQKTGVVLLPLNWRESLSVQVSILKLASPSLIIYEHLFQDASIHLQRLTGTQSVDVADVVTQNWPAASLPKQPSDVPWYLIFTSGTTGVPKAVINTWDMHEANVRNVASRVALSEQDQTLSILPQYHTAGINLFALPVLMNGGSVRVYAEADPDKLLDDLKNTPINLILLVPTLLQKLADTAGFTELPQHRSAFKLFASGGAPLSHSLWQQWQATGFVIQNGCGLTESGPTLFLQTYEEAENQPCAIGNPVPNTDVRLVGPDHQDVEPGEPGEIWIRGDAVTLGYWRNSKANSMAFVGEWFRTGDIARREHDQFTLVDRMSDMYICGGENVFPNEVEDVLLHFRGVEEVVVLGEPHPLWGETGVAFVVQTPGYFLKADDLQTFCRTRLARYKVPTRIEFVDELPKTATGKIRRGIVLNWVRPEQYSQ